MTEQPPEPPAQPATGPQARVADALVVVLSPGTGIEQWFRSGVMDREWALYQQMAPAYGRLVLVTDTQAPSAECEQALIAGETPISVVANPDALERSAWLAGLGPALDEAIDGCGSVVIKTNQFSASEAALRVLSHAQQAGKSAGLIARGGYLWSRFEAEAHGPESKIAAEVASREGELCRRAHVVVGTTREMLEDLSWRYGLDPVATQLIPNYILDSGPLLSPDEREPNTVLVCGQIVERKRVALVLRAAVLLKETTPIHVEVVGDGPLRVELIALAKELGVNATFTPKLQHEELLERMRRCTMFVQMSQREGHPKTVLEAMSAGAPVVVADAPGLGDQIAHGVTGLICPAEPSPLAHLLGPLIEDKDWRESIGEAAQLHIRRSCALDIVVPKELDAARAALAAARKADPAGGALSPVRWSPELLTQDPKLAVQAWRDSLHGYAKRLEPQAAATFLAALDGWTYSMQGEAAVRADPQGLHPKHRLTGYHDFFVEAMGDAKAVLDLGSGVGALACSIAERCGASVVGQELDAANLAKAQAHAEQAGLASSCRFEQGDITTDRVEGSFDAVVLSNVLEHLAGRPELLARWVEWYAPKRVLIRVPSYDREWRVPWKDELGVDSRLDETHEIEFTREALEAEVAAGGLRVTKLEHRWGEYWLVAEPAQEAGRSASSASAA